MPAINDTSRVAIPLSPPTGARTPPADTESERCTFLKLPKEIRLEIYEYLVSPEEIHLASTDSPTCAGLTRDTIATAQFEVWTAGERAHLSLLRTCRQVYEEAVSLMTRPSKLALHPAERSGIPIEKPRDIRWLSTLSTLNELEVYLDTVRRTSSEDILHTKFLASCFSKRLRVGVLKLNITDYGDPETTADKSCFTKLGDLQQLLESWCGIRPHRDFEFELDLQQGLGVPHEGGWDIGRDDWYWDLEHFKEDNQGNGEDMERCDDIVNLIKKAFPLPEP